MRKHKKDEAVYIIKNAKLVFWNSNIFEPRQLSYPFNDSSFLLKQANEIFYVTQFQKDTADIAIVTLLYRDNPFDDSNNVFVPSKLKGDYSITFNIDKQNALGFSLDYQAHISDFSSVILFFLILLIEFTLYKGLYKIIQRNIFTKGKYWFFLICSLTIFLAVKWIKSPLFVSTSVIFDQACVIPTLFPSFSLGRLAEIILFLMANIFVLTKTTFLRELKIKPFTKILISSTLFIIIYLSYVYLLFKSIEKTNIPFSFLQIYNTTIFSYIFLILISIMTRSIIILLKNMMKQYVTNKTNSILTFAVFFFIGFIFEFVIKHYIGFDYTFISNIIGVSIFITIFVENKFFKGSKNISGSVIIIILMTILLTHVLYRINEKKEREEMNWFAWIIGDESDKAFENSCIPHLIDIQQDDTIREWCTQESIPTDDSILIYLNKQYFNQGPIQDYHKSVILCSENIHLLVYDSIEVSCGELFKTIESNNHVKKIDNNLMLVDYPSTDSYYLAAINLYSEDSLKNNIFFIVFYMY